MFDSIQNMYSKITTMDLSIDKKYHYERIVYLSLYKITFNQIELINARNYSPLFLIIPLEILCRINKESLNKYQSCNDVIVNELKKEQQELIDKFDVYNNLHMKMIKNQREILLKNYAYQINLHCVKTRMIASFVELSTVFINILTVTVLNPIQFGCLLWFIDSVMSDMLETVINTSDKSNTEITNIENDNCKLVTEYVDNLNIIYECEKEKTYIESIVKNINSYYDIRKNVASQYKINPAYTRFEHQYQKKILILTKIIPKKMFLTWIYTDLKNICINLILSLIAYKDLTRKINELQIEKQMNNIKTTVPEKREFDMSLIKNGVLFHLRNYSQTFNNKLLCKVDDLIIPSCKWITLKGESGSGKTTLCNALLKIIPCDDKSILFLDKYKKYDYNSIRKYISNLKPSMDLFDNTIDFNLKFGVTNKNVNKIIKHYLNLFGLSNFVERLDVNVNELSTGEKQRIKIIRCILQDKPIWFLDEITSNIDHACEHIIMKTLREIQINKQKSVIHISHNIELLQYSDYNISINKKQIYMNRN
jgi:putative ABC transport system ATP-binding protein